MQPSDELMREVVRSIEDNTRKLVEFRQDITRATAPLYPRIVGIEKRLDEEARERPLRQKELDARLDAQDGAIATIYRTQRLRGVIQVAILIVFAGMLVLLIILALRWLG